MKLAIIGGGWAGLSAAVTATRLGHHADLYESAGVLGGRARSVDAPGLQQRTDNGQHILLGAYTATLALMREVGADPDTHFLRLPLSVRSADGRFSMRAWPGLPAPMHVAAGLLTARGLGRREKAAALRAMSLLRRNGWKTPQDATVQEWLSLTLQPRALQDLLWKPLCIATMNTPADQACAQLFANVLRDSVGAADRQAAQMLIPRKTLTELWPLRVQQLAASGTLCPDRGGRLEIFRTTTVRSLHYVDTRFNTTAGDSDTSGPGSRRLQLDASGTHYDAVIVCGNTPSTAQVLGSLPNTTGSEQFLKQLDRFEHAPIATLTLELEHPWTLSAPMLMLHEDRPRGHFGQWLFQGQDSENKRVHVVISDAAALQALPRKLAVAGMITQLREQVSGSPMPDVLNHALIIEKRATFLAVPGLERPGNATPWPGVWVAGDWTNTGYPAVLEGAVRSGRDAALAVHAAASGRL